MNPAIQPGMHPDAEVLAAFTEDALSSIEREQILAHMADCGRCREVVFLAHKAMGAEVPSQNRPATSERERVIHWPTALRWSWIPVAALAGIVAVAVVRHTRHAATSEMQTAQNLPPGESMRGNEPKKASSPPQARQQSPREESKEKSAASDRFDEDAEAVSKSLDQKDRTVALKKDELNTEADSLVAAAPKVSGGVVHGTIEARAKSSNLSGPMAQNQMQQNYSQSQQQNYANENQQTRAPSDSANRPVASQVAPAGMSETVAVQQEASPVPVSPTPLAAPQILLSEAERLSVADKQSANLNKKAIVLPSKLKIVSEATVESRMIAIDSAGSLFVSEDAGKNWRLVNGQWSGRAVLVKAEPATGPSGGLPDRTQQHFELDTDKPETWISRDGQTWTLASGK